MYGGPGYSPAYPPPFAPQPMTVKGVGLQPGERVVFFHHDDGMTTRILFIVIGLLMLVMVIGVFFLIAAIFNWSETTVITTHRIIWLKGGDPAKARWILHGNVRRVTRVMKYGECRRMILNDQFGQELMISVVGEPMMQRALMGAIDDPRAPAQWPSIPQVQP